ncbi:helix-turn-helix domain-containing protein [Nonomuraea sp. NPDC049504]|uniref:helix-turn-helix transcriptional regulator n=1 Tax=Nonomuraea sp. NPDC049504 TaxID=3154729 RepID=UPI003412C99E
MTSSDDRRATWTFLTHHARVLVQLARNPEARQRDIAANLGITERAVHAIINDLDQAGYLTRERDGRRNRYRLHLDQHFRHPREGGLPIGLLVAIFTDRDRHNHAD